MNSNEEYFKELKKAESLILFTYESSHAIKVEFQENKIICNLNEMKCKNFVEVGEGAVRLATEILGKEDGIVYKIEYCRIDDNQVFPCVDVMLPKDLDIDGALQDQMEGLIEKYNLMMTSHIHGEHQSEISLQPTEKQLQILKKHSINFLMRYGGQKITTPIRFFSKNRKGKIAGTFLPKPEQGDIANEPYFISAYINGFKLTAHELYLLHQNGNAEMVYYSEEQQLGQLIKLLETRHIMNRFTVKEMQDAKGKSTFKLLEIGEQVKREGDLNVF